jgi:hypothetical protein
VLEENGAVWRGWGGRGRAGYVEIQTAGVSGYAGGRERLHACAHVWGDARVCSWLFLVLSRSHIIKRFDTDAVSASSLFRAAFPTATEAEETTEMAWIAKGSRSRYGDTKKAGNEQDETKKLSGLWWVSSFGECVEGRWRRDGA